MAAAGAEGGGGGGDTLTLRLVSMAVIALVSLCGCCLPAALYLYWHRQGKHDEGSHAQAAAMERLPIFSLLKVIGVYMGLRVVSQSIDRAVHSSHFAFAFLPSFPQCFAAGIILGVGCVYTLTVHAASPLQGASHVCLPPPRRNLFIKHHHKLNTHIHIHTLTYIYNNT
jgi:hypothetical protein